MIRFRGEKLAPGAKIAVISNDALGNFVVVTPLLQLLRKELKPSRIDYYGGVRTWELQCASDLFEWSYPLHGSAPSEQASIAAERRGYDLIVNIERTSAAKIFAGRLCTEATSVCGPCGDMPGHDLPFPDDPQGDLWRDQDWTVPDLITSYPFLQTGFLGEILCRLCYLEGKIPAYRVACENPGREIPPVLISTAATLPEKLWPLDCWQEMLTFFEKEGLPVGLIGAHPIQQQQFWKGNELETELLRSGKLTDLRGKMTLPEVVGALKKTSLVLTVDNGILHLAVAVKKKTVGIFRSGIHRLWAPPSECLTVIAPDERGAVQDIKVDQVRDAVSRAL